MHIMLISNISSVSDSSTRLSMYIARISGTGSSAMLSSGDLHHTVAVPHFYSSNSAQLISRPVPAFPTTSSSQTIPIYTYTSEWIFT